MGNVVLRRRKNYVVCWVGIAQKIAKEHQKYVNLARTFR